MESPGCADMNPYGKEDSAVSQYCAWSLGACCKVWAQGWGRRYMNQSIVQSKIRESGPQVWAVSELNLVPRVLTTPAFIK